jgi:hypothetical protein
MHIFGPLSHNGEQQPSIKLIVLGDCGRYPIYILEPAKRCIKYWFKLLKLPNDRYVKICYRMLSSTSAKYFNWANEIQHLYVEMGLGTFG